MKKLEGVFFVRGVTLREAVSVSIPTLLKYQGNTTKSQVARTCVGEARDEVGGDIFRAWCYVV